MQEDKRESDLMKIYILKALINIGRKMECENCKTKQNLTFQHDVYYTHTIHNIRLLCWKCHSKEERGVAIKNQWTGVWVDEENYVHCRKHKFLIS